MNLGGVAWGELVEAARKDERVFERILGILEPLLRGLAARTDLGVTDDVLQVGRIAVWRAIPKADMARAHSICAMLLRAAYSAMWDEVKRQARLAKGDAVYARTRSLLVEDEGPLEFPGVLNVYAEYVLCRGTFKGAHAHVASLLGMTLSRTCAEFHLAARAYIDREDLNPPHKPLEEVVRWVLAGAPESPRAETVSRE